MGDNQPPLVDKSSEKSFGRRVLTKVLFIPIVIKAIEDKHSLLQKADKQTNKNKNKIQKNKNKKNPKKHKQKQTNKNKTKETNKQKT